METAVAPSESEIRKEEGLHFLLEWETAQDRSRLREAGLFSILTHVLVIAALALLPAGTARSPKEPAEARTITPLIAPPGLTQTAPNKGKISREFNAESVIPRPQIRIPPSPRPAKAFRAPALPEPPKIETAGEPPKLAPEGPKVAQNLPPPPQIQAQERPKLAFENPGAPSSGEVKGVGRVAPPNASVAEAVRSVARGGSSGRVAVGDVGSDIGGVGEAMNVPPLPGKQGSALELLSDPQGVDFRPYLIKILATVRRNWWAVMPESVKLGMRGKVVLQFAISRNGAVPKLVIVTHSGADPLDRAAVTGISMSHPFPPLPSEYRGDQIRLQFTFLYNMPAQ